MSESLNGLPGKLSGMLQRHRKWLLGIGAAVVIYALLGFFLAPWLVKSQLQSTMAERYGAELRIQKVAVNPFVLSLRIDGFELDDPSGQPHVRFDQYFVNFQLSSLFRWAWTFREFRLSGVENFITRDDQGNFNFEYLMLPASASAEPEEGASELVRLIIMDFNIQDGALHWHDRMPVEEVRTTFGPVNIRVADLNTLPQRAGQQAVVITTDTQGTLSWQGDLQLNPLRSTAHASIEGSHFPLASAYLRHETGLDIVDGLVDIELDYVIETADDGSVLADISNLNMSFHDVLVNSFSGVDGSPLDGEFLSFPQIDLTNGTIRWPDQTAEFESLRVADPHVSLRRDSDGVFNFESSAKAGGKTPADVEPAEDVAAGSEWQVSLREFRVDRLSMGFVDQSVTPQADVGISDFNLVVSDINNTPGASFPTTVAMTTASGGTVGLNGAVTAIPEVFYNFDMDIAGLDISRAHPYIKPLADVNLDSGSLSVKGSIASTVDDPMQFDADVAIANFEITETDENTRLGSWDMLEIEKLRISETSDSIVISEIRLDRAYGDVVVASDGSLNLGRIEKGTDNAENAESEAAPTDYDGPRVSVGRVVLTNASADFTDESLPLPFTAKIAELNGTLSTISTTSNEPSAVNFEGKVDEYGLVRVDGNVTPLDLSKDTDITVRFENVNVPKFTAYSIPLAGREIASGALDLDLGYAVNESQLEGENNIVLRDFELGDEVPHPDAMSLPLGLAVALLKDPDGTIDIDLPVRGNVDDPEFSYGGLIWKALGNLVIKIVASPFSLLGKLVGAEADQLEYIYFLDGRADLTPPEQQKAAKIAEALALRPELQLSFPAVVDIEADTRALQEAQFEALVEARIAETANSRNEDQMYDVRRRDVVETLFEETMPEADLQALQIEYTIMPEDGSDERPHFDALAYSTRLSRELIESQQLVPDALPNLARERAANTLAAIVAADPSLEARISIADPEGVSRDDDEAIPMKMSLEVN